MYAERAQLGVLLRAADEVHGCEVQLAHALRPAGRSVGKPLLAPFEPPADGAVDGHPAHLQVGGNGLHAPAVEVQRDHRLSRLLAVRGLVVGLEQAGELQRDDLLGDDPRRSVLAEPPARADVDDVRDLVVVERGVLGLEFDDHPPDRGLQPPAFGPVRGRVRSEEAQHAVTIEALDPAVHRALRGSGFPCPLGHGVAEQNQRPQLLVGFLLRPVKEGKQLLPVVGVLDLAPSSSAHLSPLTVPSWEGQDATG